MSVLGGTVFGQLPLKHVWIFLTERCNLSCDYCFFAGRTGRMTLSREKLQTLFMALPPERTKDIVFSGGEPLMVWPETRRAIALARSRFPRATITLQTNAVLMDRAKARALRSLGVVVQPGIDGGQLSSARHRRGTTPVRFRAMVRGIKALIREGVPLCLSMTVHPSEVDAMEENYSWLRNLGDVSLEVHPAFLSPWTNKAGECFVRAYRDISVKDLEAGRPWLRRDYSVPGPLAVDLVVRPDGRVLPNWTCLMFPRRVSEPFCLLEIAPKGIVVKHEAMGRYLDSLNRFFGKLRTYREFSNFHAEKALAACPGSRLRLRYNVYQRICEQVQKIDQRCLAARGRGEREFISRR